jgi:hypothetical protein
VFSWIYLLSEDAMVMLLPWLYGLPRRELLDMCFLIMQFLPFAGTLHPKLGDVDP